MALLVSTKKLMSPAGVGFHNVTHVCLFKFHRCLWHQCEYQLKIEVIWSSWQAE